MSQCHGNFTLWSLSSLGALDLVASAGFTLFCGAVWERASVMVPEDQAQHYVVE